MDKFREYICPFFEAIHAYRDYVVLVCIESSLFRLVLIYVLAYTGHNEWVEYICVFVFISGVFLTP